MFQFLPKRIRRPRMHFRLHRDVTTGDTTRKEKKKDLRQLRNKRSCVFGMKPGHAGWMSLTHSAHNRRQMSAKLPIMFG